LLERQDVLSGADRGDLPGRLISFTDGFRRESRRTFTI
jgi:hypothetical protein